jgi:hypothetical protein
VTGSRRGALVDLVAASMAGRGESRVEAAVFGTDDPAAIARSADDLCRTHLGARVADARFYCASVGCVTGLRLTDGRDVVLKVHQPRWTTSFLAAVQSVQASLAASGFPCPRPLPPPRPLGRANAVVEEHLPDPGPTPPAPGLLAASAAGLARMVGRCETLDGRGLRPHPMDSAVGRLYPEPHSPLFDFGATAAGAEWIDELADAARRQRDLRAFAPTIAHCDWSLRNVRLDEEGVLAAYDWDSLALVPETTAVGQAAVTWSAFGVTGEEAPSVDDVASYVGRYERARGRRFTGHERAAVGAAGVYALASTARCEHAIDPGGRRYRRARPRLAADGDRLLALADVLR